MWSLKVWTDSCSNLKKIYFSSQKMRRGSDGFMCISFSIQLCDRLFCRPSNPIAFLGFHRHPKPDQTSKHQNTLLCNCPGLLAVIYMATLSGNMSVLSENIRLVSWMSTSDFYKLITKNAIKFSIISQDSGLAEVGLYHISVLSAKRRREIDGWKQNWIPCNAIRSSGMFQK